MKPTVSDMHDGIGALDVDLAQRRVERGEELVGDVSGGARHAVEQRRLARVGVPDQRDGAHARAAARAALHGVAAGDARQARVEELDPFADEPAVGLELRLAGPAQADAAFLPLEVGPAADQSRRHVFKLRQFDLQLALGAARAQREDVEDEAGPVDDAAPQFLLEVALLHARQRVVEYHEVGRGSR